VQRVGDLVSIHPDEGGGHAVQPPVERLVADPLGVWEAGADQRRGELPEGPGLKDHPLPEQRLRSVGDGMAEA